MALSLGDAVADRYRLMSLLGSSGAADVYAARDEVLSREVALKVLRDTVVDERERQRFADEAKTLARVTHPNLVTVLDAGVADGSPYLVMELVRGSTLRERCSDGALEPSEVGSIATQLASGVAAAHAQGIIHRDLKPANVLLGARDRVKLADFGIARLVDGSSEHTKTGHIVGTAAFLAPEQVRGEQLTTATDIYSLGLVLLEALTGEREFPGPPTEAALARLSRDPWIPDSLPPGWKRLLTSMLAMNPTSRPTAAEVAQFFGNADASPRSEAKATQPDAGQTAVMAKPVTDPVPAPAPAARRTPGPAPRSSRIAIALLLVATIALLAFVALSGDDEPPPRRPVPSGVPGDLVPPLETLHDAIGGAS